MRVGVGQPVLVDQQPYDLADEQRVALGLGVDRGRDAVLGHGAGRLGDEGGDVGAGPARELQPHAAGLPDELGQRRAERLAERRVDVAVGAEDQHRSGADRPRHEAQQEQRRGVGGVEVVEHDHDRAARRDVPEQGAGRLEQPEAGPLGVGCRGRREVGDEPAELGQDLGELPGARAERRGRQGRRVGEAAPQGLDPRPVGRGAARLPAAPDEHARAAVARAGRGLLDEPALADPRLAPDEGDAAVAGEGGVERIAEEGELALAADEPAVRRGRGGGRGGLGRVRRGRAGGRRPRRVEARVLGEDRLMEGAQPRPGLDAELVDERRPGRRVRRERLRLAAGAVQREHLPAAEPLAQRVLGDEGLELAGQPGGAAALEVGVDPGLQGGDALLVEPGDGGAGERRVGDVGQRRAAPQREGVAQERGGALGRRRPGLAHEVLEPGQVELRALDAQQVARLARDEPPVAHRTPQPRHVDLDALRDRRRRRLAPDLVDQPVGRDDLVGVQQQDREQGTLARAAERQRAAVRVGLHRSEQPELHRGSFTAPHPERLPGPARVRRIGPRGAVPARRSGHAFSPSAPHRRRRRHASPRSRPRAPSRRRTSAAPTPARRRPPPPRRRTSAAPTPATSPFARRPRSRPPTSARPTSVTSPPAAARSRRRP